MKKTLNSLVSIVRLNESIDSVMKSASLKVGVREICDKYKALMESGVSEEELAGQFISEMAKYNNIEAVNTAISLLEHRINDNRQKNNILFVKTLKNIQKESPEFFSVLESKACDYLTTKSDESIAALNGVLSMYNSKNTETLKECVSLDVYAKKLGNKVVCVSEAKVEEPEVVYTKEQVKKIAENAIAEYKKAEEAKKAPKATLATLEDKTGLCESINRILAKESRNEKLRKVCESYLAEVRRGVSPAMLAESFIATCGPFGYLNAVDTELTAMGQKMTKYKQEINIMKILEMMKQTTSYYIVPLIEECVVNYVNNKCAPTRVMLAQCCENFMYDQFVRDLMYVVNSDQSIENLYLTNANVDVLEGAKTTVPFSPILYLNENAFVFNVFGNYYTKRGNRISKVSKNDFAKIDEGYKNLCAVCNSEGVSLNELTENVEVRSKDYEHKAIISEGHVEIDGKEVNLSEISSDAYLRMAMYEGLGDFYTKVIAIANNYDIMSKLDFVKRVTMNESTKSVDLFRSGNVINVALNEGADSKYYENINPIRCKNFINEHMNVGISAMFEDILPNQKLLESEMEDTKQNYECALQKLKEKKAELESLKEDSEDDDKDIISSAIKAIDTEIDDITANYKQFQKDAEELTGKEEPKDSEKDAENKEFGDDEVKDELSTPLTGSEEGVPGEEGEGLPVEDPIEEPAVDDPAIDDMEGIVNDFDEYDPVLDATATAQSDDEASIQNVSFEKNIKTGKISNKGVVTIMIPTVTPDGIVKNEMKTVTFRLDGERKPILDNDYMELSIYNKIIAAINSCPDVKNVDIESAIEPDKAEPEPLPLSNSDTTGGMDDFSNPLSAQDNGESELDKEPSELDDEIAGMDDFDLPAEGEDLNGGVDKSNDLEKEPEDKEPIEPTEETIATPIRKFDREFVKMEDGSPVEW